MDRARAAQRTAATELGAGHTEDVAHHPEHRRVVVDIDAVCLPIDCDGEGHDGLSSLLTTQETQMGSDQKAEGKSIGRWYRSVRRYQSAANRAARGPRRRHQGRMDSRLRGG